MRHRAIVAVALITAFGTGHADESSLKGEDERAGYSVGFQIGGNLKRQGVTVNPKTLAQGLQDALTGEAPKLSEEEMTKTLSALQQRVGAAQQQQQKEAAGKNLGTGKAYLDEHGKKSGVVTLPSGLQYQVLTEGSGAKPKATDTVTVHYRGTLIDGTEFDSSYKRGEPAKFRVDQVIKGWTEALQLMKQGSKWQLVIPPDLAYGERGAGPIGPNSVLVFEVELIGIDGTEKKKGSAKAK